MRSSRHLSCLTLSAYAAATFDMKSQILNPVPNPLRWEHSGCFEDNPPARTLGVFEKYRPNMNVATCTAICLARGMPIAALKSSLEIWFGQQCFCLPELKSQIRSTNCSVPCEGLTTETCGGKVGLSVYTYKGITKPRRNKKSVTTANSKIYAYSGCWQDINPHHVLTGASSRNHSEKSVEGCAEFCSLKGYSIAGLQFYGACYCSNILSGSQPADPKDCNLPCGNDESEICGGETMKTLCDINQG